MKYRIMFLIIFLSILFISCDSDYSGEASDSFNMYYAVEGGDSLSYSLEFYINSTNGIINVGTLSGNYISDSLIMKVTESDSFYMKLTNFQDDSLDMMVFKGVGIYKFLNLKDSGEYILTGRFNQQ